MGLISLKREINPRLESVSEVYTCGVILEVQSLNSYGLECKNHS